MLNMLRFHFLHTINMITFSAYLEEAKFSESNFERLLSAIERKMPKLLGSKLYRFGGPNGVEKLQGETGYLYFFGGTKAFRVRAKAGTIKGIDIWKEYHTDEGPSFTMHMDKLSGDSILGAMSKIANIIKHPEVTEIKLSEGIQLDEMAKRVEPAAFYDMMTAAYGTDGAASVTWEQIKKIADENDVLIPAYIRNQKIGRGKWNAEPNAVSNDDGEGGEDGNGNDTPAKAKKKDSILYIKVTAQDPDTKKFVSAANDAAAQKLYAQLTKAVEAPPSKAEIMDPDTLYGHLSQLVSMACKGTLRSLLIYGGPGTGKTFTIMKTISEMGLTKGRDYVKLSGKASPVEIYKTLFMFRKGGLVLFDDLDSMWGNSDATNVLKAALDTSPVREISWSSNATVNVSRMDDKEREEFFDDVDQQIADSPDKVKYPSTFEFTGRVVFISNLAKSEFDTAILSRSAKIDMSMTPSQILERMRKILPHLGGEDVSITQKEELLDHLLVMHGRKEITAVTMREFTKGLDIVRSGVENWRDLIRYA